MLWFFVKLAALACFRRVIWNVANMGALTASASSTKLGQLAAGLASAFCYLDAKATACGVKLAGDVLAMASLAAGVKR
ncbi:hypothetical protein HCDSEM_023 [Candidatus Hodgkinia cicadicola Dsem]|nr:hypothetical protein HCDSEM_023 [Candidatus Hodgkinia cicadicola Dsem]